MTSLQGRQSPSPVSARATSRPSSPSSRAVHQYRLIPHYKRTQVYLLSGMVPPPLPAPHRVRMGRPGRVGDVHVPEQDGIAEIPVRGDGRCPRPTPTLTAAHPIASRLSQSLTPAEVPLEHN